MTVERTAIVTKGIVAVNVIVFLILNVVLFFKEGGIYVYELYLTFGLVPADFWRGSWWQPLTSMFIHGSPDSSSFSMFHLLVNMVALWSLGTPLEKTIGSSRYGMLYFVSGSVSALFVALGFLFTHSSSAPQVTVGASGAVLGILGGLALFYPNSMVLVLFFPMKLRTAAVGFGLLSALSIIFDFLPSISHLGHLGGLVGGVLYTKFVIGSELGFQELKTNYQDRTVRIRLRKPSGFSKFKETIHYGTTQDKFEKEINPEPVQEKGDSKIENHEHNKGRRLYYDPSTGEFRIEEDGK